MDGYGSKAIAISLKDFSARVVLEGAERLEIVPGDTDLLAFDGFDDAHAVLSRRGFDDGQRLLRASLAAFADHSRDQLELGPSDPRQNFRMSYATSVPIQVGLSGSSAIVVATLRALLDWFGVTIEPAALVELALAVEVDYLGLAGGAMDRVIQVYEGAMLMDLQEPRSAASYERLDPATLPPLFVGWEPQGGAPSGGAHGALRARWDTGDPELRDLLQTFRDLVDEGVTALAAGDHERFRTCMGRNFELRDSFFPIPEGDRRMVEIAQRFGGVAKLCGSGGAIVGSAEDEANLESIAMAFRDAGFGWIRPDLSA
jgi:glucuronokinase